ncbi:unnamed protein product [Gadus morhua 'NCC']
MGEWYLPKEPRSDWLTDPLQPEKFKCSQLMNARDGADGTDGPTMHCMGIAPCKDASTDGCTSAMFQRIPQPSLLWSLSPSSTHAHRWV